MQPGYAGVGDQPNEVLLRFSETLPDDVYRVDVRGTGATPLRNVDGDLFGDGTDARMEFRLDLGAQVIAVVPQPVVEQPGGTLVQQRDQILVYFNDDDLYVPDAENPALYQLIHTGESANNLDDVAVNPVSVSYDSATDMAVLTFADDIHNLVGPGTYRLRIGTTDPLPMAPNVLAPTLDVGSSYGTAMDLGTLGAQSQLISTSIDAQPFVLDYPGANDEPGHREIPEEVAGGYDNHINPLFGADVTEGRHHDPVQLPGRLRRGQSGPAAHQLDHRHAEAAGP